jgi:polyhydroxyalkanoate synthase
MTMTLDPAPGFRQLAPRPLGLHLGISALTLSSSIGALAMARVGILPWIPELQAEAEALDEKLKAFDLEVLSSTLASEGHQKMAQMMSGIGKYHAHSYQRQLSQHPVVWQLGNITLEDCAPTLENNAPVLLLIPSLVNKSYILDLMPENSFVSALASAGIRPLLVNWGQVGFTEKEYTIDDYCVEILGQVLDFIKSSFPDSPPHVLGYCMGGTLGVALAQFRQKDIASFIAVATPWNFHEGLGQAAKSFLKNETLWSSVLTGFKELPVDILQAFFASLDPALCMNKFSLFDQMDQDSQRATVFVALEDWLNDGVPLAANVAQTCFVSWYGENEPALGNWKVAGEVICPQTITIPSLIAVPAADKIVPPASAKALALQMQNADLRVVGNGHIGMMVGSSARHGLWQDVIDWIRKM